MALESLADAIAALEASGNNTMGSGGSNSPVTYESKLASKVTLGNPITTNHKLGTGLFNGANTYDELTSEAISKRKFDIFDLGKNSQLGKGDFTLGTLYKHNHRGSPQRIQIDTGKKDWQGNAITINTGRAGMGSLSNLDIKGYSSFSRTGLLGPLAEGIFKITTLGSFGGTADAIGDFGKEPYIVHNIPQGGIGSYLQGAGQNRDTIPWRASLDDVSRLAQFYTSPAGLAFIAKENITNVLIGAKSGGLSGIITNTFDKIMAPPIPLPTTGFLSLLGYPQQVQGAGLGTIRKPFTVKYSDRINIGLPFGNLGDRPFGASALKRIKLPEGTGKLAKLSRAILKPVRDAGLLALAQAAQLPLVTKPTPFMDLSGGPKKTNYLDAFSLNGEIDEIEYNLFESVAVNQGDFYVRIKDLRTKRYIYFRGYVTGITENVSPSFTSTNYIGRSEPVYIYERAERDLSFNLRVSPANVTEFNAMYEKIDKLTSLAYPEYKNDGAGLSRMNPPFTELYMAHIGDKVQGQFGFIKSLSYTVPGEGEWDAESTRPRLFDISISYQILSKRPPGLNTGSTYEKKFYGRGG